MHRAIVSALLLAVSASDAAGLMTPVAWTQLTQRCSQRSEVATKKASAQRTRREALGDFRATSVASALRCAGGEEARSDSDVGNTGGVGHFSSDRAVAPTEMSTGRMLAGYVAMLVVGGLFRFLLQVLNRVEVDDLDALMRHVDHRPRGTPLLTVSNHMSVLDDPGLWAAILPFWRMGVDRLRWSVCTDDIYFAVKPLVPLYRLGNTLPINRRMSMEQPMLGDFFRKLEEGRWCHIFAEGRVWQPWRFSENEPILGPFKTGVGRLITRCSTEPIVVPLYHIGMHEIAPERETKSKGAAKLRRLFSFGKRVRVYVGTPIDISPILQKWRQGNGGHAPLESKSVPWEVRGGETELLCQKEVAETIRDAMLELERRARAEYRRAK